MNRIDHGSCTSLLPQLPAGCADLVFADPPFGIGYEYDQYDDRMTRSEYLAFARSWLLASIRVLHPHGSIFVAIGDEYAAEHKVMMHDLGLHFRNWIVWHYTFGTHQKKKFGRNHTNILYFTAHPKRFTFNAPAVMIQSERQRIGDKRANPAGRVPGDVWSEFPRIPGNAKVRNKAGHKCQMPEGPIERIVRVATNAGGLVVDPFCGTGTTPAVAARLGRRWYSCDVSEAYVEKARERIEAIIELFPKEPLENPVSHSLPVPPAVRPTERKCV